MQVENFWEPESNVTVAPRPFSSTSDTASRYYRVSFLSKNSLDANALIEGLEVTFRRSDRVTRNTEASPASD
jgi:hypothetical protein